MWNAPIACVITGRAGDENSDPAASQVVYANVAALEAHGLAATAYDDLIGSNTLLPAEMGGDVKFDSTYGKKLKAASSDDFTFEGTRWLIEKMAVIDGKVAMQRLGVAYMWEEWELDDGVTCAPGGVRRAPEMSETELEAAIEAQGAAIRSLKEDEGMGNQDPPVVEAVIELKRRAGREREGENEGVREAVNGARGAPSVMAAPAILPRRAVAHRIVMSIMSSCACAGSRGCSRRRSRQRDARIQGRLARQPRAYVAPSGSGRATRDGAPRSCPHRAVAGTRCRCGALTGLWTPHADGSGSPR